ncbi:hypothetical protein [Nonomuraea sp. NPDC049750]|uniref:hypothetical protein n=1 Tax=Nonomuraea sp. NPDC049750 TaxID=3154738 RepID=UPI0033FFF2FD
MISANSTVQNDGIVPMIKVFQKLNRGCWGEDTLSSDQVDPGQKVSWRRVV